MKPQISPSNAAELAHELGVKVYTIGVGKEGGAPIPIDDPVYGRVYARYPDGRLVLTDLDEDTLKQISAKTLGKYFRAVDETELVNIYNSIDALEKTEIKTKKYQHITEYFPQILWAIFFLLCFEIFLTNVLIVRIP